MTNSWLVLTPPIIVLTTAFITKKLNPSLIIGIIVASLIAMDFQPFTTIQLVGHHLWSQITDLDSLCIYSFLFMLGIIVALVGRSGGAAAFTGFAEKKLHNAQMAETTSIFLSLSLFVDDYLSNSTVGYVIRPLTDKFKIARAKLAFLVHSIATPLVVIAPISGWSAMITGRLGNADIAQTGKNLYIAADPYSVYLNSIPFIFYSFLMLASVWFIVRRKISYGPMHIHENIAKKTGNLLAGAKDSAQSIEGKGTSTGTITDFLVPLATLVLSIIIATIFSSHLVKLFNTSITPSFLALFVAGLFSIIVSFFFSLKRGKMSINRIPDTIIGGIQLMLDPVIMLFLAATLGAIIKSNLHTGEYLASLMMGNIHIALIPLMLFISAAIIAIATGTSWGTIAIMVPIAIPMIITLSHITTPATMEQLALLFPALGAVLSGAVCGDHISPVSETTIMASSSAGSTPIDHATTQFFYALPAVLYTGLAFLISGLMLNYNIWINSAISIGISLTLCLLTLYLLNKKKSI